MTEQKKYKTEPLKCWDEAKRLRAEYYENFLKANGPNDIRVSGSATTFWSVVAGLGDNVYTLTGEPYAANVAFHAEFSSKCMEAAERAGVARDLCGYMRNYWGSIMLDKYILTDGTVVDGFPKADFLYTAHACCSHAKWYQYVSELEGGIPVQAHDVNFQALVTEINDNKINYMVAQLMEAIPWMEKITGRKYNDEMMIEAINNECRVSALWGEICMYQQAIPAPIDEKSMFSLYVLGQICAYKKESVAFYERLRDEVKDRVARGIAAAPEEKLRIITDSQPPWAFLKVWRYLEREYGVVCVGSTYSFGLQFEWDVDGSGNLIPSKTPEDKGVKMNTREEALRAYVDFKTRNLALCGFFAPHTKSEIMKKIVKQWHADAVVIHLNRGCEAIALGQMENRLALLEENVPVLTYEGNMGDHREFDPARTTERIDSFLEGLGVKKLAK